MKINKPSQATETEQKTKVQFIEVDSEYQDQRIDNYLRTQLKGIPKSLIYRVVRKGELRVNKKRVKPDYRLQPGDLIRVPPLRISEQSDHLPNARLDRIQALEKYILYEDRYILVLNKPSGMAVHGGSGLQFGVIEGLRALRPQAKFLELVHRLDRDTSGVLLVSKKRSVLKNLHEQLRSKTMRKNYLALVRGQWQKHVKTVNAPLRKNNLSSGERVVRVDTEGKASETRFTIVHKFSKATLVQASPITGRTHQIRVHTLHAGHPIACDDKYGDQEFDRYIRDQGGSRLFLHASDLTFFHPGEGNKMTIRAPLDKNLNKLIENLKRADRKAQAER